MKNYCTIFDRNYAVFGLTLIKSILRFGGQIYVLALDNETVIALEKLNISNVTVIKADHFEETLKDSKRSYAQRCWSLQPQLCQFIFDNFSVDTITYLDSDCYYKKDPSVLFEEIGEKLVAAVPHGYAPNYGHLAQYSGVYCIQFNYFKRSQEAFSVLKRWDADCKEYRIEEKQYYPGQLSVDKWNQVYGDFYTIQSKFAGIAPWNVEIKTEKEIENLIFYHFHGFYRISDSIFFGGTYDLSSKIKILYKEYVGELLKNRKILNELGVFNFEIRTHKVNKVLVKSLLKSFFKNKSFNLVRQ